MNNLPLNGILLVTDMDGTLVTDKGVIPARNMAAIRRFVDKGGRFTFATGRSVMGTLKYAAMVTPNAPVVAYNGGGIYDLEKEEMVWNMYLPPEMADFVREVKRRFPDVGIEVYSGKNVYAINRNKYTRSHISFGGLTEYEISTDEIPDNMNKILLSSDPDRLQAVYSQLQTVDHQGGAFVFSSPIFLEVLPEGVSKGHAITILADIMGIKHDKIMAIGDYYNDREMLKTAALSAVPAGAPEDLKQKADLCLCDCNNGCVAEFIEYIEAHYT